MTLRPLNDRVLVIPDAKRETTASGLVLPQDRLDPDVSGVVAALGAKCSPALALGDHVTFAAHVGQAFVLDGTPYLMLRESEIAAVLQDQPVNACTPVVLHVIPNGANVCACGKETTTVESK